MSTLATALAITQRDLRRVRRQPSRLLGGIARPFVWLLLVATGYNSIAQLPSGIPYREFVYPGVLVMACLFGGALTAVSTVYDREFGMLRLMLASPAGSGAVLFGRTLSATVMGMTQALVVLARMGRALVRRLAEVDAVVEDSARASARPSAGQTLVLDSSLE